MAKESLFGNDFLTQVVEWSNLSRHSGKLFCSLKNSCSISVKDAVGYVSVGKDVIDILTLVVLLTIKIRKVEVKNEKQTDKVND